MISQLVPGHSIFVNILALGLFHVQLLVDNLDVNHHFKLSHSGYNDQPSNALYRMMVILLNPLWNPVS